MIEKIYNKTTGETCLKYIHPNGTTVFMLPMEGYSSAMAQFTVKFGSQDNCFRINGGEFLKIPDGTAHYLEHKLFESEEKDAFSLFAQTGASCNAGTSFDYTQYYFSCADRFSENLSILLDFVANPYFTEENVEKERGIIAQEITMYRDNPSWRVFTNLLEAIYEKNSVRLDIAGTVESIAEITPKTLYDCYNAFYSPSNMFLCVAGNFDPDEVYEVCGEKFRAGRSCPQGRSCSQGRSCPQDRSFSVETAPFDEPYAVAKKEVRLSMPVAKPLFELGFKREAVYGKAENEEYIYFNILFDMLFGESSEFFGKMRERGLLNDEWSEGVFNGRGHLFPTARGVSDNPQLILEEMQRLIADSKKNPPEKERFERIRKATYGSLIRELNGVASVVSSLTDAALSGTEQFSLIDTAARADYDTLIEKLDSLDEENASISVIDNKM